MLDIEQSSVREKKQFGFRNKISRMITRSLSIFSNKYVVIPTINILI